MRLLVFDVGGSHIAGALADTESMSMLPRQSVAVDSHGSADIFYVAVEQLVSELLAAAALNISAIDGMSFGFPGPFDYAAGVSHLKHKYEALNGRNLRVELSARFEMPGHRIQFVNDADAFLLGELTQISISDISRSIGITLGTGVGSAFAIGYAVLHEGEGVPPGGEIWNLPRDGGILEDSISTRAIVGSYESKAGKRLTVRHIAERCPGDAAAVQTFKKFGSTLGESLRAIAEPFHADRIIFGGAISRSADLFLPTASEILGAKIELSVSTLFEDAALYGAAAHWKRAAVRNLTS
ncbi:sugar kinase [Candidatus Koribacter versatilis Ellin345]|uniref:Sugar kinase n=1 Tax=Koribacter versatilis (strain Ellin345) TaxID=204669 RepID=Q1IR03_KORVE|nr:ROK family protein [Candidatus Koribacter versatilis]ABF40697.1 sugar kinase [Candidatus Koribacter versatilis Ellin345]